MQLKDFVKSFHKMNKTERSSVIDHVRSDRLTSKQVIIARTKKQRAKKQDQVAVILESMTDEERAAFFERMN
tara:strand:- start:3433 stop:3648 length:216 start_codon:yes stop_codon:yes gene_type:complete